jgi:hypothetical protein
MFSARYLEIVALTAAAGSISIPAKQTTEVDPGPFAVLSWRNIGPHRASRTVAAAGHRAQPFTFYMAQVNGGVWKTTDAGRTWKGWPTPYHSPKGLACGYHSPKGLAAYGYHSPQGLAY